MVQHRATPRARCRDGDSLAKRANEADEKLTRLKLRDDALLLTAAGIAAATATTAADN
jgi:cytochrome P450